MSDRQKTLLLGKLNLHSVTACEILEDWDQTIRFVDFFQLGEQTKLKSKLPPNEHKCKTTKIIPGFGTDEGFVVPVVGV